MTTPNLTAQADVALDHMAGTLADTYARAPGPCLMCMGSGNDPDSPGRDCPICRAWRGVETAPDASPRRVSPGSVVVPEPGVNVCILALDLGTKTGYAVRRRDAKLLHGTEDFTPRASWAPGQKWQRFRSWLSTMITENNVTQIAFEDVKRHAGTDAAHAYGAFLCLVQMAADSHRTALLPVGVGTIKKHWTGKGNADKDAMKAEARRRGFKPVDDNDSDALAVLSWAVDQEKSHGMA